MNKKKTNKKARKALKNVIKISEREMLVRGTYTSDSVVRPDLAFEGAICGGVQACAIGSLYMSAGYKPVIKGTNSQYLDLIGVDPSERDEYMADKPVLKLAYDALNKAAEEYCDANDISGAELSSTLPMTSGVAERLFESTIFDSEDNEFGYSFSYEANATLVEVCRIAIKNLKKAVK